MAWLGRHSSMLSALTRPSQGMPIKTFLLLLSFFIYFLKHIQHLARNTSPPSFLCFFLFFLFNFPFLIGSIWTQLIQSLNQWTLSLDHWETTVPFMLEEKWGRVYTQISRNQIRYIFVNKVLGVTFWVLLTHLSYLVIAFQQCQVTMIIHLFLPFHWNVCASFFPHKAIESSNSKQVSSSNR